MHTRLVHILLDAGADVSAARHGIDAAILYGPILQGNIDLMITLLDAGADPNGDDKPETHLILHFDGGRLQCAKLLIERGADLERIGFCLISALYSQRDMKGFRLSMELALKAKPNLNTELLSIIPANHGHSNFVILVLLTGTAPNVQDEDGVTAIHGAAFTPANSTQIVELLLDANANVHGGPFGGTLQAAALSGKAKPILILLKRGALPDYTGDSYGTPFQIAQKRLKDLERVL